MRYNQNCTWEGDNDVLCLQTARGLLKALMGLYMGKATIASIPQSMSYFARLATFQDEKCSVSEPSEWSIDQSEELLRFVSAIHRFICSLKYRSLWNEFEISERFYSVKSQSL